MPRNRDAEKSRSGMDLFELEVQSLINSIESSKSAIYSRRSEIIGIGIILAEGKFIALFDEAVRAYNLGMYYSTVALCGMTAERICYDYIDLCQITLRDQDFNATSKEELYHTPFSRLVEFFSKSGI